MLFLLSSSSHQEQRQLAIQKVWEQITAIYDDPPKLAPQFRSIYEIQLAQAVEHWLSLIAHQTKVSQHNFKCLLCQHKPMTTHLRTMRTVGRPDPKPKSEHTGHSTQGTLLGGASSSEGNEG